MGWGRGSIEGELVSTLQGSGRRAQSRAGSLFLFSFLGRPGEGVVGLYLTLNPEP